MAQRLREKLRASLKQWIEEPGAKALNAVGLTPNSITILGFLISAVGAALVGMGLLWQGGLVFLAGGALDLFDGALARMTGRVTTFGALLDSLFDRLGESALYLGLAVYGATDDPESRQLGVYMTLLILAFTSSQGVSYLRARGEALGLDMKGGLMTRPERVVILSAGLVIGEAEVLLALGLIAFFSTWTMLTRLLHIWRGIKTG
ncbi:MAG: CDP-alcohol phosphatidyltransferase family protein [SAR202 cluster bacterium]|nr:CDP-alcohol phosphatidyltransferase family protein [SAR202 cluster bacterium]